MNSALRAIAIASTYIHTMAEFQILPPPNSRRKQHVRPMDLPWRYPLLNVRKTNLTSHDSITCPKGSDVGYVATKVWTFTGARQQFCPDALPAATKIIILAWVPVELNPGSLAASPSPLPLSHGSSLDPLLSSTLLCSWDKKNLSCVLQK